MNQTVLVQATQGFAEADSEFQRFLKRKPALSLEHSIQRLRKVILGRCYRPMIEIIGQFHHVVEKPLGGVLTHMKKIDQTFILAGDRIKSLDAFNFAVKGAVVLETIAIDDLQRAQSARDATSHPDVTVGPAPDKPKQRIIGNVGFPPFLRLPTLIAVHSTLLVAEGPFNPHRPNCATALLSPNHGPRVCDPQQYPQLENLSNTLTRLAA